MADSKLRELERAFHESGSPESEVAWLRELDRQGSGLVGPPYLRLAELDPKFASSILSRRLAQGSLSADGVEIAAWAGFSPALDALEGHYHDAAAARETLDLWFANTPNAVSLRKVAGNAFMRLLPIVPAEVRSACEQVAETALEPSPSHPAPAALEEILQHWRTSTGSCLWAFLQYRESAYAALSALSSRQEGREALISQALALEGPEPLTKRPFVDRFSLPVHLEADEVRRRLVEFERSLLESWELPGETVLSEDLRDWWVGLHGQPLGGNLPDQGGTWSRCLNLLKDEFPERRTPEGHWVAPYTYSLHYITDVEDYLAWWDDLPEQFLPLIALSRGSWHADFDTERKCLFGVGLETRSLVFWDPEASDQLDPVSASLEEVMASVQVRA